MRAAKALLAVGGVLLLIGIGLLVATPLLLKAPLSQHSTLISSGPGTLLDAKTGKTVSGTFRQTTTLRSRTGTSATTASYEQRSVSTFTSAVGTTALGTSTLTEAFDRSTGVGKPGQFGDTVGSAAHLFKLPFHTQKRTYRIWDDTAKEAVDLIYRRSTSLHGLPVLVFTRDVAPVDLGVLPVFAAVPGSLVGHPEIASVPAHEWYENTDSTLYVEPVSGSLVGGASSPHLFAKTTGALAGHTVDLLRVTGATPDAADAARLVAEGKTSRRDALTLERSPWVIGGLGIALGAIGALLVIRSR